MRNTACRHDIFKKVDIIQKQRLVKETLLLHFIVFVQSERVKKNDSRGRGTGTVLRSIYKIDDSAVSESRLAFSYKVSE